MPTNSVPNLSLLQQAATKKTSVDVSMLTDGEEGSMEEVRDGPSEGGGESMDEVENLAEEEKQTSGAKQEGKLGLGAACHDGCDRDEVNSSDKETVCLGPWDGKCKGDTTQVLETQKIPGLKQEGVSGENKGGHVPLSASGTKQKLTLWRGGKTVSHTQSLAAQVQMQGLTNCNA
jgi:hypothetical protein